LLKHTQIKNLHEHGKKNNQKIEKKMVVEGRREKVVGFYLCIGFSLVLQQQQIHPLSPMKATWSPNLDALLHMLPTKLKGQMLNAAIHIRYPLYIDVIMFKL
jgi:hypothetical protein